MMKLIVAFCSVANVPKKQFRQESQRDLLMHRELSKTTE